MKGGARSHQPRRDRGKAFLSCWQQDVRRAILRSLGRLLPPPEILGRAAHHACAHHNVSAAALFRPVAGAPTEIRHIQISIICPCTVPLVLFCLVSRCLVCQSFAGVLCMCALSMHLQPPVAAYICYHSCCFLPIRSSIIPSHKTRTVLAPVGPHFTIITHNLVIPNTQNPSSCTRSPRHPPPTTHHQINQSPTAFWQSGTAGAKPSRPF